MSLSEETRARALAAIRSTVKSSTQRATLICLYFKVWESGVTIRGEEVRALTDHETAHITGIPIRSVNARRQEIAGADHEDFHDAYVNCPLIEEYEKRRSLVNRSVQENVAYRWRAAIEPEELNAILEAESFESPLEEYTPEIERFTRPEHECSKIADFSDMLPRGDVLWIGEVGEGLDEPYCLHFETDGRPPFVIALRKPGLKVFSSLAGVIEGRHLSQSEVQKIARQVREDGFDPGGNV